MHRLLHAIHGLDHKCRSCGQVLAAHDDDLNCLLPSESGRGTVYNPKGPLMPTELWKLLLQMEKASIRLHLPLYKPDMEAAEEEIKQRKKEYKEARFALHKYLGDAFSKLRGYESVHLKAIPIHERDKK